MDITPFTLHIDDHRLADLHRRLGETRWPTEDPRAEEDWGLPQPVARELAAYWADGFDWRAREERINAVPQFTAPIDGHELHFFHQHSDREDATPLLLLHGWPGSSTEFLPMLDALTDPPEAQPAFEVIAPSLPGFGMGGAAPGWDADRVAAALATLMRGLGYSRYWVHAYDFGAIIARKLAITAPEEVAMLHLTQVLQGEQLTRETADPDDAWEQKALAAGEHYAWQLMGYAMVQSTRPEALAYGLSDSPVGLLGWLVDVQRVWAATPDALDRDEMLTTVSLYWFGNTIASSIRYYRSGAGEWGAEQTDCPVPVAIAAMPDDFGIPVRRLVEKHNDVRRWRVLERGGHFAGWEQPELMVAELRDARTELGG
ncbi:epoxide hydrolase family protein [Enemella evansiae]|uniref:epoxide hydrolase family protein n=1 Tax=Enemella evansiae TaxID=2016499 RepID=UPI000B97B6A3|nr:epoxide hydrolase family protein [Enemella evansiae]OYO06118.1 epoxide hydrolase [Enemella evansiae]